MFPLPLPHASCEVQDQMMMQFPVGKPLPRWKPNNVEPAPNCPRCASSNTKFCYYNNYSLSQPRYFCKACRRYWTKGGFLRNVPVGGGSRKSRCSKTAPSSRRLPLTNYAPNSTDGDSAANHNQSQQASGSGSDIDMALVFANFLSSGQDSNDGAAPHGSSSSNCFTPESVEVEGESDAPQPSDPITEGLIPPRQESRVQNFAEQGLMSGIDQLEYWEGLLGTGDGDREVVQDVFWYDAHATTSSSASWHPPLMQLQEDLVEYPIPFNYDEDSQLPISDGTWTWSSFDFSALQLPSSTP